MMVNQLAAYYFISGILGLFCCGLLTVGGAAITSEISRSFDYDRTATLVFGGLWGGVFALIGVVLVVTSIFELVVAHGLWHRRLWGRVLALVMGAVNALYTLAAIYSGAVCIIFLNGFLSAYTFFVLFQPEYAEEFR
jgi:hypothetical protein